LKRICFGVMQVLCQLRRGDLNKQLNILP